jgi:hypothetical protein
MALSRFRFYSLPAVGLIQTVVAVMLLFVGVYVPAFADTWQRTVLEQGSASLNHESGFPYMDEYGDILPILPSNYQPSVAVTSAGLNVLRFETSLTTEPQIVSPEGFPVLDNYFHFNYVVLSGNTWSVEEPFSDWLTDVSSPRFASRMDDMLSVYFWIEHLLYVDTLESPEKTRVTLPIPAEKGTVAIDANGGLHVVWINTDFELWHSYFIDASLVQTKLSDGPVCEVVTVAGTGAVCHVAYTTFSEDLNLNNVLDEGEDINGNSLLDVSPLQLIYQSVDGAVSDPAEVLISNSLIRICYLDLLFSPTYGLKLAYGDPVSNSIRFAERAASDWTSLAQVTSISGSYGSLALGIKSNGDCAVSFATQNGLRLGIAEETEGVWEEEVVRETTTGAYFTGTDISMLSSGEILVVAAEKNVPSTLAAYTRVALPSLVATLVQPVEIRSAFIVSWPTPSEDVTQQTLQSTSDLSDPDSWVDVEQKDWYYSSARESIETLVEQDSPQKFFRVLEISE